MKKPKWYTRWHRNPHHVYVHWGALMLVLVSVFGLFAYSYSQAATASSVPLLQNPNRFPPDLKNEYDQIEAQIRQYEALAKQTKSMYDTGLACERSCPCGSYPCQNADEATGRAHDSCIATCDIPVPQIQSMISQLKTMQDAITQRIVAFKQKLAALKPSDLYPLPASVACGTDGKTGCTESEARTYLLEDKHISINKVPCTATRKTDCTSVANMRPETMDQIVQLQKDCNCDIRLTGGTENIKHKPGDFSHYNGYKFDMSNDEKGHSAVNKYIVDNCTADNNCKVDYRDGAKKKEKRYTYDVGYGKVEYVSEKDAAGGSHWDVSVLPKPAAAPKPAPKK